MAMSPDEVRNKTFHIARRGYERGEVHRFLDGVATELEAFTQGEVTSNAAATDAETAPDIVSDPAPEPEVIEATPAPEAPAEAPSKSATRGVDDFDRVGNEISLMLRQAQESALTIRNDAEVEARTLVDQVRLDIEADRSAHEQAAQELITRTEERASSVRRDADTYAEDTRRSADEYASARRADADDVRREAELAADADRTQAAEKLALASIEAEASVNEATHRADTLIREAEAEASEQAGALLSQAQATLTRLVSAERTSRKNLEDARLLIDDALEQSTISELDVESLEQVAESPTPGDDATDEADDIDASDANHGVDATDDERVDG